MGEEYKDMQKELSVLFSLAFSPLSGQIFGEGCEKCLACGPDGRPL